MGPWITVGPDEATARTWNIGIDIQRGGATVFAGTTEIARIKRSFAELADFLFRCQEFPAGVALFTGTGVVPPDDFRLQPGDVTGIVISGIGRLENPTIQV